MTLFSALLVPLDGSVTAARGLGCAVWLASHLGARLRVLNVGEPLPQGDALERLGVPQKYRALIELHQSAGVPHEQILAAVQRHGIDLIVLSARGSSADAGPPDGVKLVGNVSREVIEAAPVPVLLFPPGYEEALPWRSILVPISGEAATDESLTLALRLAVALDLRVTLAHVADGTTEGTGGAGGAPSLDEPHHEYPQMLNEFVSRACPLCSAEERRRIGGFRLCRGDVGRELTQLVEDEHVDLVVVGWHGQFMAGHAKVLKALILQTRRPVLLVKPQPRAEFRLKVGEALT